ncbi:IS200/IS605 family accessory protein TnpB-related protein [Vibrio crassostreae]|uniref:IS200/IS605 family accessory protein TnpB-related protein n=1 Tax=Vibrio crassostreae TaxID=246167 RepID=UPI001B3044BA|nr:IS200/IS605 family accessory protein TnpB-related protein [Vibrio crassostreae]
MSSIYHTVSTRTPKAQDALVNRVLDFECRLFIGATGAVLNDIKRLVGNGEDLSKISLSKFKSPIAERFDISTTTAYCAANYALAMYRSRDTNTREQYLPKAKNDLAKAKRNFKSLQRRLSKVKKLLSELRAANSHAANIGRKEAEIYLLRQKISGSNRRCQRISTRVARLEREVETKQYSICLGSKKQYKAQKNLRKNGYSSHADWLRDFQFMRLSGCNFAGDPTVKGGGRQFGLYRDNDGYKLTFTLSDKAREEFSKEINSPEHKAFFTKKDILIRNVSFSRAKDLDAVERVLGLHKHRAEKEKSFTRHKKDNPIAVEINEVRHKHIKKVVKDLRDQAKAESDKTIAADLREQASLVSEFLSDFVYTKDQFSKGSGCSVSPKLIRDHKGWRFDISFELDCEKQSESYADLKVIGVDTNYDHFAAAVIGENGAFESSVTLPITHAHNGRINNDSIWIQASAIVDAAKESGASIALESLSFTKKKQELYSAQNKRYNRMISSFAHQRMTDAIKRKALESGVEVIEVAPAYTSFIGRALFGELTASVHESAAYVIAVKAQNIRLKSLKKQQTSFDFSQINIPVLKKDRVLDVFTSNTYRADHDDDACRSSLVKVPELFYKFKQFETEQYRRSKAQTKLWRENLSPAKTYDLNIPF